jgi:phosphatidylinositol-3-phosphatase
MYPVSREDSLRADHLHAGTDQGGPSRQDEFDGADEEVRAKIPLRRAAFARATAALVAVLLIIGAGVGYEFGYTEGLSRGSAALIQTSPTAAQSAENQTTFTTTPAGPIKHVIVLVMENKEYDSVIASPGAPYENTLTSNYSLAANYYAVSHPSLPNYLALVAGDTFGVDSDCLPSDCPLPYSITSIATLLDAHHLSWREYAESMPANCSQTSSPSDVYDPEHDPFVYFSDITGNYGVGSTSPYCNSHVVSMDQFWTDSITSKLPAFSMITPNICDDAHSCTLSAGDEWLSYLVPLIMHSPSFSSTALFITYDEGISGEGFGLNEGGHVVCLLVSPFAKPGYVSNVQYSHYSLLATIEAIFNLGNLGRNDATANVMSDLFSSEVPFS